MGIFKTIKIAVVAAVVLAGVSSQAFAERIRDVARLKNEEPNEIEGLGIVVGLRGTGDGGDFMPTIRPLQSLLKRFDDPIALEKELKSANNVALVHVSIKLPATGAHSGDRFNVEVSSIGAAKSLKGGRLFLTPMIIPRYDQKSIVASASGTLFIDDETNPTTATIRNGGVMTYDVLPDVITDQFVLILNSNTATREVASAVADQINEDVSPQTGGKSVALALDAATIAVMIPKTEQANPTPYIARIMSLPLPNIPEPAKVFINSKTKTIVFTEEVELSPTMISHGGLTITISPPGQTAVPADGQAPFTPIEGVTGVAKLKDLEAAFNLLKVSPDDRIAIVKLLHDTNVLKADLVIE